MNSASQESNKSVCRLTTKSCINPLPDPDFQPKDLLGKLFEDFRRHIGIYCSKIQKFVPNLDVITEQRRQEL